ncbi:MAG: hypothetical protein ACI30I_06340 [Parabacteroides sp.]
MKLYHSSNVIVENPDTIHSRKYLDFVAQCARIISCISEMSNMSLDEATDIYYNSETANLIEEGVADLHCRSDKYLAEEILREYQESKQ